MRKTLLQKGGIEPIVIILICLFFGPIGLGFLGAVTVMLAKLLLKVKTACYKLKKRYNIAVDDKAVATGRHHENIKQLYKNLLKICDNETKNKLNEDIRKRINLKIIAIYRQILRALELTPANPDSADKAHEFMINDFATLTWIQDNRIIVQQPDGAYAVAINMSVNNGGNDKSLRELCKDLLCILHRDLGMNELNITTSNTTQGKYTWRINLKELCKESTEPPMSTTIIQKTNNEPPSRSIPRPNRLAPLNSAHYRRAAQARQALPRPITIDNIENNDEYLRICALNVPETSTGTNGGNATTITFMGRRRKIYIQGHKKYIMYKGEKVSLAQAKKMAKTLPKSNNERRSQVNVSKTK